jgi:DNA mismatch repair ATPase MutL
VQDFLTKIPVRKQAVLKATSKILSQIRRLLCTYAFARTDVRFSFKVLKAKNEKLNWSCAPSKSDSPLLEHATKVAGKNVAIQLVLRDITSRDAGGSLSGTGQYKLQALLISATAGE